MLFYIIYSLIGIIIWTIIIILKRWINRKDAFLEKIPVDTLIGGYILFILIWPIVTSLLIVVMIIAAIHKRVKDKRARRLEQESLIMKNPTKNAQEIFEELEYRKSLEIKPIIKNRFELMEIV